ncbi:MAG: complex I subunit 1 family protein [Bacteroidota bacterium]
MFYCFCIPAWALVVVYLERKLAASIQHRWGPTEVGYRGMLQTLADMLKLLQKESIRPTSADPYLFLAAPVWMFTTVMAAFAVMPTPIGGSPATKTGVLYVISMLTLKFVGVFMAGWGSNNKYARLGTLRALAQLISYEIPLGLSVLCVVLVAHTLDLALISLQQGWVPSGGGVPNAGAATGISGGIFSWYILRSPGLALAYLIFFITSLAACHRAPFDLAEAESELIGGFRTEYGGLRWAWIMLSEYGTLFLMSLLGTVLFLGSWQTPFLNVGSLLLGTWTCGTPGSLVGSFWAFFWLFAKSLGIVLIQMGIGWSLPRLRFDQVIYISWVYLTPIAFVSLLVTVGWHLFML